MITHRDRPESKPITKATVRLLRKNGTFGEVIDLAEKYANGH